jgi:hypothetical protein
MANTNRPSVNTHQQIIIPPNGSGLLMPGNVRLRYYNNYPVVLKQIGQDPEYYVKRRPPCGALTYDVTTSTTQQGVSSSWYDPYLSRLWFVNYQDVCYIDPFSGNSAIEDLGRLQAFPSLSSIIQFKVADKDYVCVLDTSSGFMSKLHFYDRQTGVFVKTVDLNIRTNKIVFMDGYIFMSDAYTSQQRIYNTTIGNEEELLEGASFLDAEMQGDPVMTIAYHHNHIAAFGRNTIEFFYNAEIEIGSPLQRQVAYAQTIGLYDNGIPSVTSEAPAWAMCEIQDDIYFVGALNKNIEGLFRLRKFKAEKVSDYAFDTILRRFRYPKLYPFDLEGEMCVLVCDLTEVMAPYIFIPSKEIAIEINWGFVPIHATVVSTGFDHATMLFKSGTTQPFMSSGRVAWPFGSLNSETFTSQYTTDYIDLNNNAKKHWKYVDVIGAFGTNLVAIGYRNDNYAFDNAEFVNLPYRDASNEASKLNLRFRNLGVSRRQGYTVFIDGPDDYLYRGLAVGYNQWGE